MSSFLQTRNFARAAALLDAGEYDGARKAVDKALKKRSLRDVRAEARAASHAALIKGKALLLPLVELKKFIPRSQ